MGLSLLTPDIFKRPLASLTPEQRRMLGLLRPATDEEIAAYERSQQSGAPADFSGPVFENANGARVSEDTESGIEPTRLPTGVAFQHQNFSGAAPMATVASKDAPQGDWFDQNAPKAAAGGEDWFKQNAPRPDFAANPPAAAGPHVTMREHDLFGEVPENLSTRTGERIRQNLDPLRMADTVSQAIKEAEGAEYKRSNILPNLKKTVGQLKETYSDPANIAGDVMTAGILGVGSGAEVPPDRPPIAGAPAAEAAASAVKSPVESLVTKALTRYAAKKIPGYHLINDAVQFAKDMGWTEEKAAAKAAPVAAEPVPMTEGTPWGKPILNQNAPVATPAPAPAPVKPAKVEQLLNESLGGRPLQPGVSLRNQPAAQAVAAGKLPEGFTPVESSALKGYKYDLSAREFEYITKDGQHYVRGDVDPSAVERFEQNPSAGKGLAALRNDPQGGVGQYKVINGERVAVKPGTMRSETGEIIPKSAAGTQRSIILDPETGQPEFSDVAAAKQKGPQNTVSASKQPATAPLNADLTGLLQKSLKQARTAKNAPRFVYRARDVGEEGVPLNPLAQAQAGSDLQRITKYAEPGQRSGDWGQVVRIDLSKLKPSDYVLKTHPDGSKWVQFTRPLGEDEVTPFAGKGAGAKQNVH